MKVEVKEVENEGFKPFKLIKHHYKPC